ncbi:MAG: hypothetical protein WKF66_02210 [Pedobacter sp.]
MIQKKLYITEYQYLSEIINEIPTNTVVWKKKTGIGATYLELNTERNSIILEPNVPVIKGKKQKGIMGVFEGIDVSHIMQYMSNESYPVKKFLVTPESFYKVLEAAANLDIDLYSTYFILFDECDRTMKDVGYRETIILPMDDFFKFKNKAFISATAVIPSDPRFLQHNFECLIIEPDHNYQKLIKLIETNNVSMSLKNFLSNCDEECVCIFLNSIQGIAAIIKDLGIAEDSNIYCSKKKAKELAAFGSNRSFENLTDNFAKYNFFTSRFNSAVDIFMDLMPTVVMVTNLNIAYHTAIDPYGDAVQIVGRFRNGVKEVIAISNFDQNISTKTPEQAKSYLEGCEESYNLIRTLRNSTTNPGAFDTLNEALQLVKYSTFISEDGSTNHFMVDNFMYEETVKHLFHNSSAWHEAYCSSHFLPSIQKEVFFYSDKEDPKSSSNSSIKELTSKLIGALEKLEQAEREAYSINNASEVINELRMIFPEIVEGYYVLGAQELSKNSYSKKQIKDAVKQKRKNDAKSDFGFINALQSEFQDNYAGPTSVLKKRLAAAIQSYGLNLLPTIELLKEYFEVSSRTSIKGYTEKGYRIYSCKFAR